MHFYKYNNHFNDFLDIVLFVDVYNYIYKNCRYIRARGFLDNDQNVETLSICCRYNNNNKLSPNHVFFFTSYISCSMSFENCASSTGLTNFLNHCTILLQFLCPSKRLRISVHIQSCCNQCIPCCDGFTKDCCFTYHNIHKSFISLSICIFKRANYVFIKVILPNKKNYLTINSESCINSINELISGFHRH